MGRRGLLGLTVAAALPVAALVSGAHRNIGSTPAERSGPLPGDNLAPARQGKGLHPGYADEPPIAA